VLSIPGVIPSSPEKFFRDCFIIFGGEDGVLNLAGDFLHFPAILSGKRKGGSGSALSSFSSDAFTPKISSPDS